MVAVSARLWIALFVCLIVFALPACSGGDDDDDITEDESPAATRTPRPPRGTPTPEHNGAPVFSPGGWTAGEAQVTTSGGAAVTVTGTLLARSSSSTAQTTHLTYTKELDTINLSISREYQPLAVTVFQGKVYMQSRESCEATYTATDEKRIEGSFRCTGARVEQGGNGEPGTIEGTFFATR